MGYEFGSHHANLSSIIMLRVQLVQNSTALNDLGTYGIPKAQAYARIRLLKVNQIAIRWIRIPNLQRTR